MWRLNGGPRFDVGVSNQGNGSWAQQAALVPRLQAHEELRRSEAGEVANGEMESSQKGFERTDKMSS